MDKIKAILTIPELRWKLLITLGFLSIYRIGYSPPLPFANHNKLGTRCRATRRPPSGRLLGLGPRRGGATPGRAPISPVAILRSIPASIFSQLRATFSPPLEKLQK